MSDTRWQSTQMDCDKCGYEWAAVHPAVCEYLQCPVCGHMTPAPATPEPTMKLVNLGCGGHRPQDPEWWNLDELRKHLKMGTPERINLDAEPRYIECRLGSDALPFDDNSVDGMLCQHVIEHMDCHTAATALMDCRRALKPDGWLCVSVPDAQYFLENHYRDNRENAERVFGEPISEPWHNSFFDYALFHMEHIQILTEPAVRCLLIRAGFKPIDVFQHETMRQDGNVEEVVKLKAQLNRLPFSCILFARKVVVNG